MKAPPVCIRYLIRQLRLTATRISKHEFSILVNYLKRKKNNHSVISYDTFHDSTPIKAQVSIPSSINAIPKS